MADHLNAHALVNQERDEKLPVFASAELAFQRSPSDYQAQLGNTQVAFTENFRVMQDIHRKVSELAASGFAPSSGGAPR